MTYCVGVLLNDGVVLASDSRTHAGVDNFSTLCKMTVFERPGDRVIVLLSSETWPGRRPSISVLKQRGKAQEIDVTSVWNAQTMFDVAVVVLDAVRDIERRDSKHLASGATPFNASFIIGGQIKGEPLRLFRTFAEGNFIEASADTPFFQTGEAKSFVCRLPHDQSGKTLVATVIGFARAFNMSTVAEGVETLDQLNTLSDMGCDQLQGYLMSKPVPRDDFAMLLERGNGQLMLPTDGTLSVASNRS